MRGSRQARWIQGTNTSYGSSKHELWNDWATVRMFTKVHGVTRVTYTVQAYWQGWRTAKALTLVNGLLPRSSQALGGYWPTLTVCDSRLTCTALRDPCLMHQILPLAWLKLRWCSCSFTALRVFFPCRIIISSWLASLAYVQLYISSPIRCHTIYQSRRRVPWGVWRCIPFKFGSNHSDEH